MLVQALRAHPNGPPEIRLGLAQCLFRLGKFKLAEAAFRRTLDCSPGCGPALLGLAITSFYKSSDKLVLANAAFLWLFPPEALTPSLQHCDTLHKVLAGATAGSLLHC